MHFFGRRFIRQQIQFDVTSFSLPWEENFFDLTELNVFMQLSQDRTFF